MANPTVEGIKQYCHVVVVFHRNILLHGADSTMVFTEIEQGQLSFLIENKNFPSLVSNMDPNSQLRRWSESSEGFVGHKLCHQNKEVIFMTISL